HADECGVNDVELHLEHVLEVLDRLLEVFDQDGGLTSPKYRHVAPSRWCRRLAGMSEGQTCVRTPLRQQCTRPPPVFSTESLVDFDAKKLRRPSRTTVAGALARLAAGGPAGPTPTLDSDGGGGRSEVRHDLFGHPPHRPVDLLLRHHPPADVEEGVRQPHLL